MKLSNYPKKLKSAKHLKISGNEPIDEECLEEKAYITFAVGDRVKFINIISKNPEDWGMDDLVEFKIFKGHLGMIGTIIEMKIKEHLPVDFNLFMTVRFDDGYIADEVTHFAFEPIYNSYSVINFEKEKVRILKERKDECK